MTYIEFFEKDDIENICACLTRPPERVILLGDKVKRMRHHAQCYTEVLAGRGHQVEFLCREVNKHQLDKIVEELEQIIAFANQAASITASRHGAIPAMPSLSEVLASFQIQKGR